MRKAGMIVLALGALVFINSGCIGMKKKEWKPIAPQKTHFVHTVQYAGETLSIISKWYTGDDKNWEVLADANPHVDFEKLATGNKIFIPENLLKTRKPLTEKFVATYYKKSQPKKKPKKKKPSSKTETPPEKKEEFDLFGPK
jgi:hypothetical protein